MKILFMFLIVGCSLALSIPQPSGGSIRLRRSIHAINATERKGLFWSIKMLSILPAPKTFTNWTFKSMLTHNKDSLETQKMFTVKPVCLYDILIASHSSACQHTNFYFAYQHRHLMILTEIWLNFAHQILKKGKQKLFEHYPTSLYNNHSQLWDKIFKSYAQQGMADLSFLSVHYWNPSNYQNQDDILIPLEFDSPLNRKDKKIQTIDLLHFAVRGHYPWDMSLKHRMVAQQYKWDLKQIVRRMRKTSFFRHQNEKRIAFNSKERAMLKGKLTPRIQPIGQNFQDFMQTIENYLGEKNKVRLRNHIQSRFEDYFNTLGQKDRIPNSTPTKEEIMVNYGVKANQTYNGYKKIIENQYISKAERRRMNLKVDSVTKYNRKMPHYTLAYAMFNRVYSNSFLKFLDVKTGIPISHNQMHNYYGEFLTNLAYSIFCPHFYLFHSWIDFQLEAKIRNFNNIDQQQNQSFSNYQEVKDYIEKANIDSTEFRVGVYEDGLKQREKEIHQRIFNAEIGKFLHNVQKSNKMTNFSTEIEKGKIGNYAIFDWINPLLTKKIQYNTSLDEGERPMIIALPIREFILTDTRIRQSNQLSQLYINIYVRNQGHYYKEIVNLTNFPFDHDYQVYNGPNRPTQTLDQAASNIHDYLQALREQVQEIYDPLDASIIKVVEETYNNDFYRFHLPDPNWKKMYRQKQQGNAHKLKALIRDYYLSFLRNCTYGLAIYNPKTEGTFSINLRVEIASECATQADNLLINGKIKAQTVSRLRKGISVHNLTLNKKFHRHDSIEHPKMVIDTGANLLEDNIEEWKAVRLLQLGLSNVLFTSQGVDQSQKLSHMTCISKSIVLSAQAKEKKLLIKTLKGAEEIKMFVEIEGVPDKLKSKLPYKVLVTAKSYSIQDNSAYYVSRRSDAQYGAEFHFDSIEDRRRKGRILNHSGLRLYQSIRVDLMDERDEPSVIAGSFQVIMPAYSKLLNLKLVIAFKETDDKGVHYSYVRLEDADYYIKKRMLDQLITPQI